MVFSGQTVRLKKLQRLPSSQDAPPELRVLFVSASMRGLDGDWLAVPVPALVPKHLIRAPIGALQPPGALNGNRQTAELGLDPQ